MKIISKRLKPFLLTAFVFTYYFMPAQIWIKRSDVPSARSQASSFIINNKLYMAGGFDDPNNVTYSDLWEYDIINDSWTQKTDLPGITKGSRNAIAFSINGFGYVGLGVDTLGNYKNELWEYDPTNDLWAQKTSLPGLGREGSACFVLNNMAYIIGGAETQRFAEVWLYDPLTDTWTLKGNYPAGPIISPTGFSINGKGYVSCGYPGSTVTKSTYEYNPSTNQWSAKANFKGAARQELVSFVLGNKAYCGLGRGFLFGNVFQDVYSYDPATNSWTQEVNFTGSPRCSAFAASDGTYAYVGSGRGGSIYQDFYEYTVPLTTALSEANSTSNNYLCYPVPSAGNLYIKTDDAIENTIYVIMDECGKVIVEGKLAENHSIETNKLFSGRYTLLIQTKNKVISKNIVIEK